VQGNVVGCPPEAVAIGQRVRAVFEEATDPATGTKLRIPQWELLPGA
jgi:coenzyme F420-reducing hydrogenase gamma subunit